METASVSLRRNQWQGQPTILWFFFHWVHKWWPTINRALLKHQVTDDKRKSVQQGETSQSLCSEVNTVPDDPFIFRNTEIVSVGKLYGTLKHRCDSRGAEVTGQGNGFSKELRNRSYLELNPSFQGGKKPGPWNGVGRRPGSWNSLGINRLRPAVDAKEGESCDFHPRGDSHCVRNCDLTGFGFNFA